LVGARVASSTRRGRIAARRRARVAVVTVGALALAAVGAWSHTNATATPPPPAAAYPGIRVSFGPKSLATDPHVIGGQIVFDWSQIEPQKGVFCWNNPRVGNTGCGTSKSNAQNGLDAQLAYFQQIGKEATVQVNSTMKPTWIYAKGSGVERCGTYRAVAGAGWNTFDIPMYWTLSHALNAKYFTVMSTMLTSFANAIGTSPNRSVVSGVRVSPNLVGTEFRFAAGRGITLSTPHCSAQSAWNVPLSATAYAYVMKMNYSVLEVAGIRPILRQGAFTNLGVSNLDPTQYLAASSGTVQPWYFATSSNPDAIKESKDPFDYAWARAGKGVAYDEAVWSSDTFENPVSWNYWNVLMNLDRGTTYIAMFGKDVALASTNSEYAAAYDFADMYAGYNTPTGASSSPGAWIALAPQPGEIASAPTRSLTDGNLAMFMSEDPNDGSVERDSLGVLSHKCRYDAATNVCAGVDMIGSPAQRYGRWARSTGGAVHPSILLSLDPAFKSSLDPNATVDVYVTYLDCGDGTWQLDWGTGSSDPVAKHGSADCSSPDDQWVTAGPIEIPVTALTKSVAGDDFGLTSVGGDTTFHMLEARRGPALPPPTTTTTTTTTTVGTTTTTVETTTTTDSSTTTTVSGP
jgi:hypothetical protein